VNKLFHCTATSLRNFKSFETQVAGWTWDLDTGFVFFILNVVILFRAELCTLADPYKEYLCSRIVASIRNCNLEKNIFEENVK